MLTDNSFSRLSDPIVGIAESFTLRLLRRLKRVAKTLARDPGVAANITEQVRADHEEYVDEAQGWVDENLPVAYMRGIKETDGNVRKLDIDAAPTGQIGDQLLGTGGGGDIAGKAADILEEFPRHHTMYSVFQEAAYDGFRSTRYPVVRDIEDKVRELTLQASEAAYRDADTYTRRQFSQELLNRFADNNITGMTYRNGRRITLDAYAEMVARTQTGNAARQATMNRQREYGFDLVRISKHFPTSDLCEGYQGRVFSISGTHDHYPALQTAVNGGLYHPNCKHFQDPYFPGLSPKQETRQEELSTKENRERYEMEQEQRKNERNVRKWKRREASAMTERAQDKARAKVRHWQGRNRQLVERHDFLRRKYNRESITGTGRRTN